MTYVQLFQSFAPSLSNASHVISVVLQIQLVGKLFNNVLIRFPEQHKGAFPESVGVTNSMSNGHIASLDDGGHINQCTPIAIEGDEILGITDRYCIYELTSFSPFGLMLAIGSKLPLLFVFLDWRSFMLDRQR